jgi:hypothetical protein
VPKCAHVWDIHTHTHSQYSVVAVIPFAGVLRLV